MSDPGEPSQIHNIDAICLDGLCASRIQGLRESDEGVRVRSGLFGSGPSPPGSDPASPRAAHISRSWTSEPVPVTQRALRRGAPPRWMARVLPRQRISPLSTPASPNPPEGPVEKKQRPRWNCRLPDREGLDCAQASARPRAPARPARPRCCRSPRTLQWEGLPPWCPRPGELVESLTSRLE